MSTHTHIPTSLPSREQWTIWRTIRAAWRDRCVVCGVAVQWLDTIRSRARLTQAGNASYIVQQIKAGTWQEIMQPYLVVNGSGAGAEVLTRYKKLHIPVTLSGIGCPTCQQAYELLQAAARVEYENALKYYNASWNVTTVYDKRPPCDSRGLRLPTSVSTRSQWVPRQGHASKPPTLMPVHVDVTAQVLEVVVPPPAQEAQTCHT